MGGLLLLVFFLGAIAPLCRLLAYVSSPNFRARIDQGELRGLSIVSDLCTMVGLPLMGFGIGVIRGDLTWMMAAWIVLVIAVVAAYFFASYNRDIQRPTVEVGIAALLAAGIVVNLTMAFGWGEFVAIGTLPIALNLFLPLAKRGSLYANQVTAKSEGMKYSMTEVLDYFPAQENGFIVPIELTLDRQLLSLLDFNWPERFSMYGLLGVVLFVLAMVAILPFGYDFQDVFSAFTQGPSKSYDPF